ncbi:hypothetical protein [Buttiauxella agrestis]|uniref:hypothetical protein n=1 Tax=Buttiauxella agrestis TaxID=82977 RepID=UPI003974EF3C
MCEVIIITRVVAFFIIFSMALIAVFSGVRFCKKKGIDFNSFSGMFEMYTRIFKFEEKAFSILMLSCMYGGALLGIIIVCISAWATNKGCVFPTQYSK